MKNTPDIGTMETYRRQMMDMFRTATPSPAAVPEEEDWLDSRFPVPNIEQDKTALPSSAPAPTPSDYVGYLRVYAFTGGGAEPISGAQVTVTRADDTDTSVYAQLTTNRDGFTPVVVLPSVDPALSLRPGGAQPYVTYAVRVTAAGFQPVEHRNIPVYGDNYVTQPVAMIPLLPGRDADTMQEFTSGGPANL